MFLERLSAALVTIVCFSTLAVGANNFTQTDATTTEKEIPLAAPLAFAAIINPVSPECNSDENGYFSITIENPDSLAYTFEIRNSSNVLVDNGIRNINPFNTNKKLGAGSYTIRIKEISSDLSLPYSKTITETPAVTLSAVATSPTCSGQSGSIVMTANGSSGYTYYLNKGLPSEISQLNGNFTISQSGNYTATVNDSKGCPGTFPNDLIVKIPEVISPSIDKIDSINCPGGKASITLASLPVDASSYQILLDGVVASYSLNGTTAKIENIGAGSHILKVTRPTCLTDVWPSAAGQSINIVDYQSLSFDWNNDPNNITLNCYGSDTTLQVKVMGGKPGSTVKLTLYDPSISETITISPSLPFNQIIDIPNLVADVTYVLSAQNNNDLTCTPLTRSFSLKRPPVFEIASINTTPVKCFGNSDGTITFNVSGGTSSKQYFVDGNPYTSNVVTDLPSGPHTVFVKDGACSTNDTTVTISQPTQLVASHNVADDVNLNCPGGSNGEIHLTASGGSGSYKYDLVSGSNTLRSGCLPLRLLIL